MGGYGRTVRDWGQSGILIQSTERLGVCATHDRSQNAMHSALCHFITQNSSERLLQLCVLSFRLLQDFEVPDTKAMAEEGF